MSCPICTKIRRAVSFEVNQNHKRKPLLNDNHNRNQPNPPGIADGHCQCIGKKTQFVQRERIITGAGFAQALVFGWLHEPGATRKQLHVNMLEAGMQVSVQGFDQRFNEAGVAFMRALLETALEQVVKSEERRVVLPQFKGVVVTDCTALKWGAFRLKLGTRFDLQSGYLQLSLEQPTVHDQKKQVVERRLSRGMLHLGDLGFFKLARFRAWNAGGVYWLSRFKVGSWLRDSQGQPLALETVLAAGQPVNIAVQVGKQQPVPAFLVAAPLGAVEFEKRQAHLKTVVRKKQRPLSARQQALVGWTLYLTNIPDLTFEQAHTLARTRWQIELLFKLWKSHAQIAVSRSANPLRQQCEGYAKLLAVLVAHWLLLVSGWQQPALSALDALHLIQRAAPDLLHALPFRHSLKRRLYRLKSLFDALPRLSRRKHAPLAFQLWEAFDAFFP